MAGKYVFHRPTGGKAKSAKPNAKTTGATRQAKTPPVSRWTFHNPKDTADVVTHGWHHDGADSEGSGRTALHGARWTCDYGCKSFVWSKEPEPGQYHAYDCPYWQNEGKHLTPF